MHSGVSVQHFSILNYHMYTQSQSKLFQLHGYVLLCCVKLYFMHHISLQYFCMIHFLHSSIGINSLSTFSYVLDLGWIDMLHLLHL